jgi:hypothetical protein
MVVEVCKVEFCVEQKVIILNFEETEGETQRGNYYEKLQIYVRTTRISCLLPSLQLRLETYLCTNLMNARINVYIYARARIHAHTHMHVHISTDLIVNVIMSQCN